MFNVNSDGPPDTLSSINTLMERPIGVKHTFNRFLILWGYCLTPWKRLSKGNLIHREIKKKKKKVCHKPFLNTCHPTHMLFILAAKSPFYAVAPLFNIANFRLEISVLSQTSFILVVSLILEDEMPLSIISMSIIFRIQFYYSSRDSI